MTVAYYIRRAQPLPRSGQLGGGPYQHDPVTFNGLIRAMQARTGELEGLSDQDFVDLISANGTNFQLTPAMEQQARSAGATDVIIAAVRSNYRGAAAATTPVDNGIRLFNFWWDGVRPNGGLSFHDAHAAFNGSFV